MLTHIFVLGCYVIRSIVLYTVFISDPFLFNKVLDGSHLDQDMDLDLRAHLRMDHSNLVDLGNSQTHPTLSVGVVLDNHQVVPILWVVVLEDRVSDNPQMGLH